MLEEKETPRKKRCRRRRNAKAEDVGGCAGGEAGEVDTRQCNVTGDASAR